MRIRRSFAFLSLFLSAVFGWASPSINAKDSSPQIVEIPTGKLHLKAYLWKPPGVGPFPAVLFNHGSGEDVAHTAGLTMTNAAETLAPVFLKHGYAFLYLFRRGHGPSSDQAHFMADILKEEEDAKGKEARQHLQFLLSTGDHLDDVLAALHFLQTAPGIDSHRIAIAGHSFGGQLTLFAAEHDATLRAVITFGAAAASWSRSPELRGRLRTAIRNIAPPIMLVHAANDYSTEPGNAMASELERLHKPHVLKIYPAIGQNSDDGHNMVYHAIPVWEDDVFRFLDEHLKH
jgi:dienelactone hydrolase